MLSRATYRFFSRCGVVSRNCGSRCFRICFGTLLLAVMGAALFHGPVHGQPSNDSEVEYRVKAAFILNFTKFVTWPNESHGGSDMPITLCILGESPFGAALDSIKGKKVHGRPITIVYSQDPETVPPCHIVFFGGNLETEDTKIVRRLRTRPVLTVGEHKGFADRGGMINFIVVDNRVRFEINPLSVEAASLKISSQLLKLAIIIETDVSTEK